MIGFAIHHYPTVLTSAPNKVSVVLSQPRGQIQKLYCCFHAILARHVGQCVFKLVSLRLLHMFREWLV